MGRIWVTSDFHFNHDKPFIYKARGFSSIAAMNEDIINKYNDLVTADDDVFILGDVVMGDKYNDTLDMIDKLKGNKYLALGNHDTEKRIELFKQYNLFKDIQVAYRIKRSKKMFMLSHYPMVIENTTKDRVWSLHGHTHSKEVYSNVHHAINVAVDAWNCHPVSLDKIVNYAIMAAR